jgi:signal peptidase I
VPQHRPIRKWLPTAIIAVLGVLLILKFLVADLYSIPQNGMYPSLPGGSRFLGLKKPYHDPSEVLRGDVIVFRRTLNGQSYQFVWRVIGLPGDHVALEGDSVKINGQPLPRHEVRRGGGEIVYRETNGPSAYEVAYQTTASQKAPAVDLTVPAGEFFVMGDNRDGARDSRFDGTVRFEAIVARRWSR